jgi:hypothetical protein
MYQMQNSIHKSCLRKSLIILNLEISFSKHKFILRKKRPKPKAKEKKESIL